MDCSFNSNDLKNLSEIKNFLDENGIEYNTENSNFCLWHGNPGGRRSFEIEYVPSLLFPISYPKMGISGVPKNFFYKLSVEAEERNSFKFWIKDFEWQNERQREILKSQILHAADKTPHKFYARECEIKEVPSKEAREFEVANCFYGKRGASLNIGLYLKKEKYGVPAGTLLMLYTFGLNFFGKKEGIIEIIRVGTRKFSNVTGGSSKLLKHFLDNYKIIKIGEKTVKVNELKYYSDYDHHIGSSLPVLGFEFTGYTGGGFMNYWLETGIVKHREPIRHKWVMEQMSLGKCLSVPNAGTKNYTLKI